ncbi:hypothetical protein [Vulcaniibacterium gelatinicum]|uniref:hypothetical protein n=1 Tax=Vulcaniibacterium gelatinicum TaxID=2598725 RepID=UPI0011CBDD2F|nr:hypothetical protein [Vulcaniibacterium gelatinicum]
MVDDFNHEALHKEIPDRHRFARINDVREAACQPMPWLGGAHAMPHSGHAPRGRRSPRARLHQHLDPTMSGGWIGGRSR